jgi:hypothetical protein
MMREKDWMPIAYRVDHEVGLVVAAGQGILTDADVFGYQRDVWSRPDVTGYNELIDMTQVTQFAVPSADRVRDLARLAARMDDTGSRTRLAVVASTDVAFGLGRMFQSYRQLDRRGTKEMAIFRTMEEALTFLQIEPPLVLPDVD